MKKILIDMLGGDYPERILEAMDKALKIDPTLEFILVGDKEKLGNRWEVIHSTDSIGSDEAPTVVRTRKESSISIAAYALRDREDCGAFVSAGNTGAVLTAATLIVGRIPGVLRPALCPSLPTLVEGVRVMIIDAGANMDSKPEYLVQFAIMGSEQMKTKGVESPRVALVNVGTEDNKGNELTAATFIQLKQAHEAGKINFVGNMEANEMMSGKYDVIVCDGFVGNILLKTAEGSFRMLMSKVKGAFRKSIFAMIGGLMSKRQLMKLRALGSSAVGGSIFIGTKKPVVKAHGSASVTALVNAILVARDAARSDLATRIEKALENKG
ncbi:MAG: phosphate acyltransferase PlsX [Firmicutes bacterium]|nr:phosphate acyltransferase PlsX [Bacillota bacterium]